ncbi:MAG: lysozyme inhibitor LprI family protein [Candidatus Gastranaerophilaceae bacterium]|nr:lysozyme inhibitor LprI family protein [Candidatus Gastranaerophilaceae bacterium]
MKNLILVLSVIILLYGNSAYTHVIDDVEVKCIANTSDTQEMNKCSKIAQVSWEKEIKKSLIQLKKRMDNTSYKSLMKSQRIWQEYKNQEFSFIQKITNNKQGTMYLNVEQGLKTNILKQRALILQEYIETLND